MSSNPLLAERAPTQALSDVVARIGAEVARPLTLALDRVQAMASTGRIDRPGLQALRDEIDGARRAGMLGQRIARLAGGLVQPAPERLRLATLLRDVLTEQSAQASGQPAVGHRPQLDPVEVTADASLVATLLRAAADWACSHACAPVDWRLQALPRQAQAVLTCTLVHQAGDEAPVADAVPNQDGRHLQRLDSLDWLLLRFAAHLAGVETERTDAPSRSELTLRFPGLLGADAVTAPGSGGAADAAARRFAGAQVLVLAARREARQLVREAMQGHDLFIDYVPTVAAARTYCDEAAPQVLIFESAFTSEALAALCTRLDALVPAVALVEVQPQGRGLEQGSLGEAPVLRIGLEALRRELAPRLLDRLQARR